ncbi:hypothetical protein [Pedobacter frigiditerrae]|uniref:hypothetical protein n=1 Tax=Pedobacter frigiditerrae TaxID=2530452 RepID=UPI002930DF3D|nr:hypothetical protein [Pedobacter frigiditerrae]
MEDCNKAMNENRIIDKLEEKPYIPPTEAKVIVDPNKFGFMIWAIKDLLKTRRFTDFYKEVKKIYLKNNGLIPQEDSDVDLNRNKGIRNN